MKGLFKIQLAAGIFMLLLAGLLLTIPYAQADKLLRELQLSDSSYRQVVEALAAGRRFAAVCSAIGGAIVVTTSTIGLGRELDPA